jgi:hypothetical protein
MKTYLIENIPEGLWQKFKAKTTKDVTINDKIISLIDHYVERAEKLERQKTSL